MAESTAESSSTRYKPPYVVPGEDLTDVIARHAEKVVIGRGLRQTGDGSGSVYAQRAGRLLFQSTRGTNLFWIESNQRRYHPQREDVVVGVVERCVFARRESFLVQQGAPRKMAR